MKNLSYEKGMNFYDKKDYVNAYKCFEEAASNNSAEACIELAKMHFECLGKNISYDEHDTLNDFYINKAISLGSAEAHYLLAFYLMDDIQSQEEFNTISEHFKVAAAKGYSHAYYELAEFNKDSNGFVATLDKDEIIETYKIAIKHNEVDAMHALAYYLLSLGNNNSVREYFKYLQMAININHEEALSDINGIGQILIGYRNTDLKGLNKIIEFLLDKAENGDSEAFYQLSILYDHEDNLRDEIKSMKYAKLAADLGHETAQYTFAFYSEFLKEYSQAFNYYLLAANQGNTDATYHLGLLYKLGLGTDQDFNKAFQCFKNSLLHQRQAYLEYAVLDEVLEFLNNFNNQKKALEKKANLGDIDSLYKLGIIYEYSKDVTQDLNYAFDCYVEAADKGHTVAQYRVGVWYDESTNMDWSLENEEIGKKFFTLSALKGYIHAEYALGWYYHRKDKELSHHYFKIAADKGIAVACRMTAVGFERYYDDTKENQEKAFHYYLIGANLNEGSCLINVIRSYKQGHLVKENLKESERYLRKYINLFKEHPYGI